LFALDLCIIFAENFELMSTSIGIETIKSYCSNCQNETNHEVLYTKEMNPDEFYTIKYMTIQCMGCENISFSKEVHDFEAIFPDEFDNWIHDISVTVFPKYLKNHKVFREQYL
jgi:hypothetical protein